MTRKEIERLIDAIDIACYCATGEPSGVGEVWDENIDKLEQYIESLEIHTEDNEMTESAKELFAAARHMLEAMRRKNIIFTEIYKMRKTGLSKIVKNAFRKLGCYKAYHAWFQNHSPSKVYEPEHEHQVILGSWTSEHDTQEETQDFINALRTNGIMELVILDDSTLMLQNLYQYKRAGAKIGDFCTVKNKYAIKVTI